MSCDRDIHEPRSLETSRDPRLLELWCPQQSHLVVLYGKLDKRAKIVCKVIGVSKIEHLSCGGKRGLGHASGE
jgi:hypothetical protein